MTARFTPISRRTIAGSIAAFCAALALGGNAVANTWPEKTVTLVVPYSAGGPTDVVARAFADHASRALGQPFIIDNKPGAGTIIAAQAEAAVQRLWRVQEWPRTERLLA